MASMGTLLIFAVIYVSTGNAKAAFMNVECKTEKMGQYGQQSLLECVVKPLQDDTEIRVVTWKKEGNGAVHTLLVFNRGETEVQPGYSFAEPSWNVSNMNISLLIANTAVEHEGVYRCMVMTDRGDGSNHINFKVSAKYNKPTVRSNPEKITLNVDGTLMCESKGGYPKGELRWFDENNKTKSSEMKAKPTESGLFHLSSKLTVERGSSVSRYTCRVFNASGGKEEETQFVVQDSPEAGELGKQKDLDPASKIVAPVVVIGSLIIGLLMALLIYKRRYQQARRHSTTPLMGDHRVVRACESDIEEGDLQEMDKTCQDHLA